MKWPLPEFEGPIPQTGGDAGHRVEFLWSDEDRLSFGEKLRAEFGCVFIHERILLSEQNPEPEPALRIVERLDLASRDRGTIIEFPHPSWTPKLAWIGTRANPGNLRWTLDQYWSPVLHLMPRILPIKSTNWDGLAADNPIEFWATIDISTSYRRSVERERRIEQRAMSIAKKIGRKMVPIEWQSCQDFRANRYRIWTAAMKYESIFAGSAAIDWVRAEPHRALRLRIRNSGAAISLLPPEDIPEEIWGDYPKPKWAQDAIAKHNAQTR